jgi:hypothetical protein
VTVLYLGHYSHERIIMKYSIFIFISILGLLTSCNEKDNLPKASGKPGEIVLIIDSIQWKGKLGSELKKIFRAPVPGLPQDEPMFTLIWAHPERNMRLLTQLKNIVYVFTLDQNTRGSRRLKGEISPETLKRIQQDTSFFLSTIKNEFAKGQEVMYLFSATEQNLIQQLQKNGQKIIDYFNNLERERLAKSLFNKQSLEGIAATLRREQKIEISVPPTYKLADKQPDFLWLRKIEPDTDKDIFITWKPYESEYQFLPDSIIAWRDATAKKYLFEDPKNPISYLVTEREDADVLSKQVSINKHFAMEVRGLWRTNNRTMGGPFLGYAIADEPQGLIYYIEGFAYAPGRDKREFIRELETILWSFKTSADIKQ